MSVYVYIYTNFLIINLLTFRDGDRVK